jgi:CHAT domain-containing protein
MGLQRAFQVAGARALVSTLWQVDDVATALLMEEFYTNLWERRLPKLESLRQAQLTILRRYDPTEKALRPKDRPETRVPAYFWAAFSLSGDWR